MIDSHFHLTDPRLLEPLDAVLARARAAGVERMVTIGTDIGDATTAIALCEANPNIRCAVGIHPNYCHESEIGDVAVVRDFAVHPTVVALGEMGLDYHHKFAPVYRQRRFFEAQLNLASETGRNVIIHCREAIDDALAMMRGFERTAVFHCFTGTAEEANRILAAGFWISYTGAITFKRNDALRECVRLTPRDRLMVETDAPYLSPEPFRAQKINEPALVVHTAAVVANAWNVPLGEVDRVTTENAERFFGWPAG